MITIEGAPEHVRVQIDAGEVDEKEPGMEPSEFQIKDL
jgi:hypothetical protein